ncbi:hypothetical protein BD779DRAFT_242935 [Infundibulicybe gibba]|nr:hypothetical protein BD779DRAFT_242935 [Infundibulicybe gibba]
MKFIYLIALFLPVTFAAEYLVGVGKDETTGKKGKGFDPSVIHPVPGDVISFEFRSGAHSVVQSTFENPCIGNGGFNSGVKTVSDDLDVDAAGLPTVKLLINDTQPIWFFDEAGGLCYKGAVLAVNPTSTQTAAAFVENASKASAAPPASSGPPGAVSGSATSSLPSASSSPAANSATILHISSFGVAIGLLLGFA